MNRTHFRLWIFALFGVQICCTLGATEEIDPRLKKVLADWQKRQNAVRSVRYEVRGERRFPKGASEAIDLSRIMPTVRRDQSIPPQDLVGMVSLTMLLDFEKGRHHRTIREPTYHLNSGKLIPWVREDAFDGTVAKGAMPREENPSLGKTAPEFSVVSGNMKYGEFLCDCFPIFFGHGRIYTVFEPTVLSAIISQSVLID